MSEHGGNLREAAQRFGDLPFLDFSANINPLGVPDVLSARLHEAIERDLTRYPDPDCARLREALAAHHGVPADWVLCGNGASELLKLSAEYVCDAARERNKTARILIPQPAFCEYAEYAQRGGAQAVSFFAPEGEGFALDLDALLDEAAKGTDAVILGNPNNPTSALIERGRLRSFVAGCGARGVLVILDEAFIELTIQGEKNSLSRYLGELPNLILIRAVTKSLAVPGLRLGYALAHPELLAQLKKNQITWSVNALAQCVGDVLPALGEYRRKTAEFLSAELPWMVAQMNRVGGVKAYEPYTNFMLCKLEGAAVPAGSELHALLARRGILIRRATFEGLSDAYFRVAIRARSENERLLRDLNAILNVGGTT